MPPLVGAAVAATGSASVALGKRTLSPEDGHEQGCATSGHATKKRHVKDASTRIYPPPLQLTDEEDASQSNVPGVRKLKRTETLVVVNSAEHDKSSTDTDTDDSSDEECTAPLTQAVIQKMELEASYSQVGYSQEDYSQAGYTQEDYLRADHPREDYSLAGYSQAQEDYSQADYSQEDNWQAGHSQEDDGQAGHSQEDDGQAGHSQEDDGKVGHSQEDDWQAGHSQEDYSQAGHSQEDYSQVGLYTLFDPEAAGAASEDNGAARAHSEATLVHSEATPVRSKAMHPRSEAMHGRPEATHSRTEAVHGRSEATRSRSEAMHGRSEATRSRTEAVHSRSEATHSHSEVTRSRSKVTHARVTHPYSEATPKALRTRSRAAPAHSVMTPAHSVMTPAHSMTTPSRPEGSQGTHSGSAVSNGHRATPAHSNNRQVSEPIGGWPDETNLRSAIPRRPKLTEQTKFLRDIITASFPHLRASIMIYNAFPDAALVGTFVLRAFLAATSHNLHAVHVHQRILHDHVYLSKMIVLPRARITVFRAEVKDRCVAAVALLINVNDSPALIADLIDRQLNDNYNYIFPRRSNSLNILSAAPARRLPYRSNIITSVIRDLFFTGPVPFATQHRDLFPTQPGVNGTVAYEIPKSMLALVSTAGFPDAREPCAAFQDAAKARVVRVIQTTSPAPKNWSRWHEEVSANQYVMDYFSSEELDILGNILGLNCDVLRRIYNTWGPSTRNCVHLTQYPDQEGPYADEVEIAVGKFVTKFQHSPTYIDPFAESHEIISVRPKGKGLHEGRTRLTARVATRRVERMILLQSIKAEVAEQISFYKMLSTHKWFGSLTGYMLKSYVLACLSARPTSKPLPCIAADSGPSTLEVPVSLPKQSFSLNSAASLTDVNNHTLPFCLIPSSNYVAFDAIVCSEDSFFTIQVTVSSTHSANPEGFENLRRDVPTLFLADRTWYHVFVTTDKRKAKKLRNMKLKNLPAEVIICSAVFDVDRLGSIHERLVEMCKKKGGDTKEEIIHGHDDEDGE
ncbi:hypothetical protein EDB84DRAFT_1568754 [Lactarius hengduanensis]|nr:hypothetical protein EDB84DRAFT_1568754 [Lactarius hengduanensis]